MAPRLTLALAAALLALACSPQGAREDPLGLHRRAIVIDLHESIPRDLLLSEPVWSDLPVEANATRDLTYTIKPMVRGRREWGLAVALVGSPLGLLRRRIEGRAGDAILVQPETRRYLRSEALDPKRPARMRKG